VEEVWKGSDRIKDYDQINQEHAWNTICIKLKQPSKTTAVKAGNQSRSSHSNRLSVGCFDDLFYSVKAGSKYEFT
jgi:hypothetical protein